MRRLLPLAILLAVVSTPWLGRAKSAAAETTPTSRDLVAYQTIVASISKGESFYTAASYTLPAFDFPTTSVFNWRQPTVYYALAWLGPGLSRLWMAVTVLVLLVRVYRQLPPIAVVAVGNACLFVAADSTLYFPERWSGVCILLSLLASLRQHTGVAVGWAVVALTLRELAAPYCIAMSLLAVHGRKWREVAMWVAGGVLYLAFFGLHAWCAMAARPVDSITHAHSWLYFGGLPFLLETFRFHGILALAPSSLLGLVAGLLVLAAWAPSMPRELRLCGVVYAGFFLVIGQPFNAYWGSMAAPLLACWLAFSLEGARSIWNGRHSSLSPVPF